MGYLHINQLYKDQRILLFRECFALEKVHGTSAHVHIHGKVADQVGFDFFAGGESHDRFVALFDQEKIAAAFRLLGHQEVTVYGEAYGSRQQGMKATYGPDLRFIAFDVQVGESWLSVPDADQVATGLDLEFVPYVKIQTDLAALDAERDRPSEVAVRRGCGPDKKREGIVLRPLIEVRCNNGERIIAKHKRDEFKERETPQKVVDPAKLEVLVGAQAIADEWVTAMRLGHVLDKMPGAGIEQMRDVIKAMVEDVHREAKGEIVESKEATAAIGRRTAELFKARLKNVLVTKPAHVRPTGFNAGGLGYFFGTFDQNDQPPTLAGGAPPEECAAHYADLLSCGWRATRWEHSEGDVVESAPMGGWKWTTPAGVAVEDARSDRRMFVNGKLIAIWGFKVHRDASGNPIIPAGERADRFIDFIAATGIKVDFQQDNDGNLLLK